MAQTQLKKLSLNHLLLTVKHWQSCRLTWLIMFLSAFFLEAISLFFQYELFLQPCEQCVYQRLAILILALAALIMMLAPRHKLIRYLGYGIWSVGVLYGLESAIDLLNYYSPTGPLAEICKMIPDFPFQLPLYNWFPGLFLPSASCGQDHFSLFGLNIAQLMLIVFCTYLLALLVCLASLFSKKKS